MLHMDNRIIYDYVTFSSQIHSTENLIDILGLGGVAFDVTNGYYGYRSRLFFCGISIHYDGAPGMGVCVEMSGKGCRTFEEFGSGNYDVIFALVR